MIYHAQAETADEIAKLLRTRGRIVVTAPSRSGKTTELIRYAEERYPNGRFAVVAQEKDHDYIIRLHWCLYNGINQSDVVAKRLLGQELEGDDVMTPQLFTPESIMVRTFNASTPTFVDEWFSLSEECQRVILRRRLFIAGIGTERETPHASSEED